MSFSQKILEESSDLAYKMKLTADEVYYNMGLLNRNMQLQSSRATHKRVKCQYSGGCTGYAVTKLPLKPHQQYERFCPSHKPTRRRAKLDLRPVRQSGQMLLAAVETVEDDDGIQEFDDSDVTVVEIRREPMSKVKRLFETIELCDEAPGMPDECEVCYDSVFTVMLKPCQHWMCKSCIMRMNDARCPFCRRQVELPQWLEELRERDKYVKLCQGQGLLPSDDDD
jgi:hypothetical protein